MGYQSKTWSLSDEVVAEIERRVQEMTEKTGSGSPNRVLREVFGLDTLAHLSSYSGNRVRDARIDYTSDCEPEPSTEAPTTRELSVELGEGEG